MIAPLIKWDHKEDYFVFKFDERIASEKSFTITFTDHDYDYIAGHEIDGKLVTEFENCIITSVYSSKFRKSTFPSYRIFIPCMASNSLSTPLPHPRF